MEGKGTQTDRKPQGGDQINIGSFTRVEFVTITKLKK